MPFTNPNKGMKKPTKSPVFDAKIKSAFPTDCVTQIGLYAFQALADALGACQNFFNIGGAAFISAGNGDMGLLNGLRRGLFLLLRFSFAIGNCENTGILWRSTP